MAEAKPRASEAAIQLAEIAFRELTPELLSYIVGRSRDGTDALNLMMEVYERVLRAKHVETIENPRAWIFRIARHVLVDAQRCESSRPVTYNSEVATEAGDRVEVAIADDFGDTVDAARELQRVRQALKQLPPVHQAVLWLAVYDGLSHKEVARRTGLSAATVTLYVCEARAKLRTILRRS